MRPDPDRLIPRRPQRQTLLVRAFACTSSVVVGVFVVLVCLLELRLEAIGLGRPRDTGIRPGYMVALAIGAIAGVVVPTAICLALLKGSRRLVAVVAGAAAVVVAVSLFGVAKW
jgi:hypothetical protein